MSDELPEIEVFRTGKLTDSNGVARTFTEADLDEIVSGFNAVDPVPLVRGHPKHDDNALGFAAGLRRVANKILAKVKPSPELVDDVRANRVAKVSIALWPKDHGSNPTPGKWAMRHIGVLGAANPAVPGLAPLAFAADVPTEVAGAAHFSAEDFLTFSGVESPTNHTEEADLADKEELARREKELADKEAAFAADQQKLADDRTALAAREAKILADAQATREADNAAFVAGMVATGTLIPGHKDRVVAFMNSLDASTEIEFSADQKETPLAQFKRLCGGAKPLIQFGIITDPTGEAKKVDKSTGAGLDAAALAYQAQQKAKGIEITFDRAIEFVAEQEGF